MSERPCVGPADTRNCRFGWLLSRNWHNAASVQDTTVTIALWVVCGHHMQTIGSRLDDTRAINQCVCRRQVCSWACMRRSVRKRCKVLADRGPRSLPAGRRGPVPRACPPGCASAPSPQRAAKGLFDQPLDVVGLLSRSHATNSLVCHMLCRHGQTE